MYNIKAYEEILNYFKEEISLVNLRMKSLLCNEDSSNQEEKALNSEFLYEIQEFLFSKSKRLRPVVVFLIADMFNLKNDEDILNLACAVEILHSATLIHDDIVDSASLRRGKMAFYLKFGPKIAVLAGDYLLSLSLKLLSKINLPEIFKYFSESTLRICKGEICQFFNRGKIVKIEEYLEKSKDKTGALFMAGAKSAFKIIERKIDVPKDVSNKVLRAFDNFSLGFQIYDDIENFSENFSSVNSDKTNLEKVSSDIQNGIYTLPYLYLSQENLLYDNITKENRKLAIDFSNNYLNNILDNGINCLDGLFGYKVELIKKLIEAFKNKEVSGEV